MDWISVDTIPPDGQVVWVFFERLVYDGSITYEIRLGSVEHRGEWWWVNPFKNSSRQRLFPFRGHQGIIRDTGFTHWTDRYNIKIPE